MRALSVSIFEDKKIGNCSNHGISERYNEILLICEDGNVEIDEDNIPENLCKIVSSFWGGKEHKHIEPVAKPSGVGWMSGGCICYTSDARFDSDYPLSLHDRTESQEMYDMLSH